MKKIKKLLPIWLASVLTFCVSVTCFTGCEQSKSTAPVVGPISDGTYYYFDKNGNITTYIYSESSSSELYWEIEGDEAECWVSGSLNICAKIVEKDGKIYFEGYKWDDPIYNLSQILLGKKQKKIGFADIYLVEYNGQQKSITLELYKKGE